MNARFTPAEPQQTADELLTENALMFAALRAIANTDSRDGLDMRECAAAVVNQVLETRIDNQIKRSLA